MANIIPKLNLNKTPNLVDDNSLVFAKNIRLDVDNTIHRDYGIFPLSFYNDIKTGDIINYNNILNRIIGDINIKIENESIDENLDDNGNYHWLVSIKKFLEIVQNFDTITNRSAKYKILGVIPDSNDFYLFFRAGYSRNIGENSYIYRDYIIKYSEKEDIFTPCNCNWSWSDGTISGCVIKNLVGDIILNIAESNTSKSVLFKSINLNKSSIQDDENIYTQLPKIPITNLLYNGDFDYVIPNGVYQFFVRYEIDKDFYTGWFPASNEIFVGNSNIVDTSFGSLKYVNTHRDSDNSFILQVEHIVKKHINSYKRFQVGFLLSHDDTNYARAWKHFNFTTTNINFDYEPNDSVEIEPTELLNVIYGLYNVENVTSFKNKLYVSNYTETNFNDVALQTYANKITLEQKEQTNSNTYNGYKVHTSNVANTTAIAGLYLDENDSSTIKTFYGIGGIFEEICNTPTNTGISIDDALDEVLDNKTVTDVSAADRYGIRIIPNFDNLYNVKNELKNKYKNSKFNNVEITYNVEFGDETINECTINNNDVELTNLKDNILNAIYSQRYLNFDNKWIDVSGAINDSITIKLRRTATVKITRTVYDSSSNDAILPPSINPDFDDSTSDDVTDENTDHTGNATITKDTISVYYYQYLKLTFVSWNDYLKISDSKFNTKYTTLIPYQFYKFYIHYVKDTGEITNGFECKGIGEIEVNYADYCKIIYPKFSNIEIPEGYNACFFSIVHTKNNVATLVNIKGIDENKDGTVDFYEATSFDTNMMLIRGFEKLHIKQGDNTETYSGTYYYSSDSSVGKYFGADGVIKFTGDNFVDNNLAYIVNNYSISETDTINLVKCTPYLYNSENSNDSFDYSEFKNMNLLGYICGITPLKRDTCIDYYSDGSSVYHKEYGTAADGNPTFTLSELGQYTDSEHKLSDFDLQHTDTVYVYSNFNLNYVTLSEDPKISLKTYYLRTSTDTSGNSKTYSKVLRLLSSQLLSDIYTLTSMYKNYTRKMFSIFTESEIVRFDNTVRSSETYGDENKLNLLKFAVDDYYNIPTNRGIITNLIAIGDFILVHTKDSMFRFTGSNNLQSTNGEIQPTETEPFNTGISEVFGSDYGFAGLQYKTDSIVTEQGYIFFDRDSRIVYMYSGQEQVAKLNESIEKLFRHRNISNVYFANDFYNNRFFMSILFYDTHYQDIIDDETGEITKKLSYKYYPVTLSFNIHQNVKSFVSLHDFYYKKAFNTKNNCYFLTNDLKDICTIDKKHNGCYTKLELITDSIYPNKYDNISILTKNNNEENIYNVRRYLSIVDVISNANFENIKTLNAVNWCGNIIDSEYKNINTNDESTLRMAEDILNEYPCSYFRIYTDTCMTALYNFKNIANKHAISSAESYKYPRYNQGYWTTNYFRNILNAKNENKYDYISDENSLIEGKYFVIRFVFDEEFKLETLTLNYNIKI